MLNIWQRMAAALLGWKYALIKLNAGTRYERWRVFRVYTPSAGPCVVKVWTVIYSRDTFIDGSPAVKEQWWSWDRLTEYEYRPLTRGLP